jgi:hypothetical protein
VTGGTVAFPSGTPQTPSLAALQIYIYIYICKREKRVTIILRGTTPILPVAFLLITILKAGNPRGCPPGTPFPEALFRPVNIVIAND